MDDKNKLAKAVEAKRKTTLDIPHHKQYDWTNIQNMIKRCAIKPSDVSTVNKVCSLYTNMYVQLRPRFGQYIVSNYVKNLLSEGHKNVINGSICRFGKTYCMAYDVLHSNNNLFLFITSQPKTIVAISSIFKKYDDFKDYELLDFSDENDITKFTKINRVDKKTILFVSIQTLKSKGKGKRIKNLKKFNPMCLIDEFHTSGETVKTDEILKEHNLHNAVTVFYSATYENIKEHYNVPDCCVVSWGIEDNIWCSTVEENTDNLRNKYGNIVNEALTKYIVEEIESHYKTLPRLKFIVDKPSQNCLKGFGLKNKTDKTKGYSFDAVKMVEIVEVKGVKKYKLVNEDAVVSYFQRMLGGGVLDNDFDVYVGQDGMIDVYKKLCDADGQSYGKIIPVYMGDGIIQGEQKEKETPGTLIYQCVQCIIECLMQYKKTKMKGIDNYTLVNYNTAVKDPEAYFDQLVVENPDKTIILFLGSSLTTGITNKYCDLIKLTRRIGSHDLFWQTICRAMNESVKRNKKYAYICVDDYQSLGGLMTVVKHMKLDGESEQTAWKRLMKQNIFNICDVDYDGKFIDTEVYDTDGQKLFENVYGMVRDGMPYKDNLMRYVQSIDFGNIKQLSKYLVNLFAKDKNLQAQVQELAENLNALKEKGIEKGIEVEKIKKQIEEKEEEISKDNTGNCQEMLGVLMTTYVMLTIEVKGLNIVNVVDHLKKTKRWNIMIERCCKSFGLNPDNSRSTIFKLNEILMDPKNVSIVNESIATLKEQLQFTGTKEICYEICQDVIMTTSIERKQNAEVLTPLKLVKEMMSKIPVDAWTDMRTGNLPKIFDPCVGKGAFIVVIYDMLFALDALKELIPDDEERRKTILVEMIYFADINPFNIFVTKMILDPSNKYKLNAFTGDTLEMDIEEVWGFDKFDIIVGNPPYNDTGGTGTGNTIWQHFVKKYIGKTIYLCFVHPPGWRKPNTQKGKFYKMFDLMALDNQMLYLSIHGIEDGKKTFNAGTRYDWYVIKCVERYSTTIVNDEVCLTTIINMNEFNWLPNSNITDIRKILTRTGERCPIIQSMSAYEPRKKWMSAVKTDEYKYPCVHSTPKSGVRYMYSNRNDKGHFGVSKVIFGESGIYDPVIDMVGTYGMTHGAMAIQVSSVKEANEIKKILVCVGFQRVIKSCMWSSFRVDWNIFTDMKKNFWREFI
jgi:hypothetical protein